MKKANQILSVLLGLIFIISSTGILVYETHCSCTGTQQVGIYVKPETCENEVHLHHTHDISGIDISTTENCCHECSPKKHDCGCETPEVHFFKLTNDYTQDEIDFERTPNLKISDTIYAELTELEEPVDRSEPVNMDSGQPPKIKSSKNFLIQINQLKIPVIA